MLPTPLEFPYGAILASGQLKTQYEDFQVQETLTFEPCGEGEHHYLYLRKQGINTEFLAKQLQEIAEVPQVAVSFAGRKDRHAITTQWFSVHSHATFMWPTLIEQLNTRLEAETDGRESVVLLAATRHNKKLRKGEVLANQFKIRIRNLIHQGAHFERELHARLQLLTDEGMANYFGAQRFQSLGSLLACQTKHRDLGDDALLLSDVELDELLSSYFQSKLSRRRRGRKGFDLSIARSYLFNRMLADRVSHIKPAEEFEDQVPLVGESRDYQWEGSPHHATMALYPKLSQLIYSQRIQLGWRQAFVRPTDLQCHVLDQDQLELAFSLPSGSYATILVAHFLTFSSLKGQSSSDLP